MKNLVIINFLLKLKKVYRYLLMYGFSRTLVKVKGVRHSRRIYTDITTNVIMKNKCQNVGIIGCGNFSYTTIAYFLRKNYGNVIKACMDIDRNKAISLCLDYKLSYFTTNPEDILDDTDIKLIYIASNHASHSDYAIRALSKGKVVHVEKPHVVSYLQLINLCRCINDNSGKLNIGFNRPLSKFANLIFKKLDLENDILMVNWFISGHSLKKQHWYYDKLEGGRILGNLSHWIDFSYQVMNQNNLYPITIKPTISKSLNENLFVSYIFGDNSIASIGFSAKGEPFEGVQEVLSLHKGNSLIKLLNFQELIIDKGSNKTKYKSLFKDQGHENSIKKSWEILNGQQKPLDVSYIWQIGELMLKTKEAIETNKEVIIDSGYSYEKVYL